MDKRINQVAARANISTYDAKMTRDYVDGAPHLKHASLRKFYSSLIIEIFDNVKRHTSVPKVLDLGAGEGTFTLPFLEHGAKVVAVDISKSQLDALHTKCLHFGNRLEIRNEDINDTLQNKNEKFDIVVANSILHHIPDYLGMIKEVPTILNPFGQFFSFQDPLRYDSLGRATTLFSLLALFSWRIFKGDVIGGIKRRIRRSRGIYLEDSFHDNAEYHVTRNGVDQEGIEKLLNELGFDCNILSYFSTQSSLFQPLGKAMGVKNTFAVVAKKCIKSGDTTTEQAPEYEFAANVEERQN